MSAGTGMLRRRQSPPWPGDAGTPGTAGDGSSPAAGRIIASAMRLPTVSAAATGCASARWAERLAQRLHLVGVD